MKKGQGGNAVKVYHICEICQQIFDLSEVPGQEGSAEMPGICNDCADEMGFTASVSPRPTYYN